MGEGLKRARAAAKATRGKPTTKMTPPTRVNRVVAYIPEDPLAFVPGCGWRVSLVRENATGHKPTGTWPFDGKDHADGFGVEMPWFWGMDRTEALERCERYNAKRGISPEETNAVIISSMGVIMGDARRKAVAAKMTPDQRDMVDLIADVLKRIHEGSIVKLVIVTTNGDGDCRVGSTGGVSLVEAADILSRARRSFAVKRTGP